MLQAYIYNWTPRRVIGYITPYYKQYRQNTSINNIHKFGQYIVIHNKNPSKITDRGYYRQWLGFDNSSKGHITWHHNKITIEHNIQFLNQKPSEIEGDLEETSRNTELNIDTSQEEIPDKNQQTSNTNKSSLRP